MYPRSFDTNEDFCNSLLNVGNVLAVWAKTPPAMQMPMTMRYRITLEVVCEPAVQEGRNVLTDHVRISRVNVFGSRKLAQSAMCRVVQVFVHQAGGIEPYSILSQLERGSLGR